MDSTQDQRSLTLTPVATSNERSKHPGGRPRVAVTAEEVRELRTQGLSLRKVARQLGVSVATAWNLSQGSAPDAFKNPGDGSALIFEQPGPTAGHPTDERAPEAAPDLQGGELESPAESNGPRVTCLQPYPSPAATPMPPSRGRFRLLGRQFVYEPEDSD